MSRSVSHSSTLPEYGRSLPQRARDPVCGREVTARKAKPVTYAGRLYYCCSWYCRSRFEAMPSSHIAMSPFQFSNEPAFRCQVP